MKNNDRRVYRSRKPLAVILKVLLCLVLAALLLTVALFFGLKKHIVVDGDNVRLDLPWINEELAEIREKNADT